MNKNPAKRKMKLFIMTIVFTVIFASYPSEAYAMHIMEGFLPLNWVVTWFAVSAPFLLFSVYRFSRLSKKISKITYMALSLAFVLVLSSIKFPSVFGSSSHLTGIGIGTIILGPVLMPLITFMVLIFQAVALAHGGLTTLGANVFSMGIVGPYVIYIVYRLMKKINKNIAMFTAVFLGNILVYVTTAMQLGLVYDHLGEFLKIFAIVQIPLAIFEGLVTMYFYNYLTKTHKLIGEL